MTFLHPLWGEEVYRFSLGPEIYHMKRWRQGGTRQRGWLFGGRVRAERIKDFGWYVGLDGLYAEGELRGQTGSGFPLQSNVTDWMAAGRLGYAFKPSLESPNRFIPYWGYGYLAEKNQFKPPSRLTCTFHENFYFTSLGFLSSTNFTSLLSMGLNFEMRFMTEVQSEVTGDPLYNTVHFHVTKELQTRVEIPFAYSGENLGVTLSPFYEYRHFGGREGYPFNYLNTQFSLLGLMALATYQF